MQSFTRRATSSSRRRKRGRSDTANERPPAEEWSKQNRLAVKAGDWELCQLILMCRHVLRIGLPPHWGFWTKQPVLN